MIDIENRWALVTGASRGIGLRIAKALANKGCKLIVHSRELQGTKNLLDELKAAGHEVYAVAAELDSIADVQRLISEVRALSNDHLDILYNNAAMMTKYQPTFEPTEEEYRISFRVNTIVPAKLCDVFLPGMIARNWGRIVNVSSGINNQPQLMPYSCSKAALERYVRDMIPTLQGTDVLMNLLDPGWLRTDLGGPEAPDDPDSVLPGALVPVLLEKDQGSGLLFCAQDYAR
ncbi:SDR family NAD(P)-dependent oxidoreductase [Psychromonas antarctica]|uniref:SDR family NAD(P)-dependent oxidoreductase n=1 Tax=Psychromonas antarctica TaxID=67573 RepID=UPI001EE836F7|nr:SDR family oxidoreductase [Psychromonas antarctica]MCG6201703.1 SDR family oxidoreductase [Psychromonas antarctica]